MLPLNEENFGLQFKDLNKGGKILDLEKNYRQYLTKDFLEDAAELQDIAPEAQDWWAEQCGGLGKLG